MLNKLDLKVLLVEDNDPDARFITEILKFTFFKELHIERSVYLKDAKALTKQNKFDIILLDLSLPDSSGLDTVKAMLLAAKDTPIIVMTALNDESMAVNALHSGAQDYIIKGQLDENTLTRAIHYAIERQTLQNEMSRLREEFLAILIHDLKAPLTSILGISEFMIDLPENITQADGLNYLRDICRSGKFMLNIINNIIEVPTIEAGQLAFNFENFRLDTILKELDYTFKPLTDKLKIKLKFTCPENTWVYADINKIKEVFHNLLSNASKHTPPGGKISVCAEPKGEKIFITVADTGSGIPESEQDKIFQKFSRVKGERHGTGLGLYIVKNFLAGHNTDITFLSEPLLGTSFFFDLKKGEN